MASAPQDTPNGMDLFTQEQLLSLKHEQAVEIEKMRHTFEVENAKLKTSKVAKIQARRDVKVARANSENYQIARGATWFFIAAILIITSLAGCQAAKNVTSGTAAEDAKRDSIQACVAKKMEWDGATESCERP